MKKNEIKVFEQALRDGDSQKVKGILAQNPKAYNVTLFKETDALEVACRNGHVDLAGVLIELGANINRNKNSPFAPLHSACAGGHVACVQLLIDHGAHIDELTDDFDGCDQEGKTPLHVACENVCSANSSDLEACIRLLIENGANINAQDAHGKTPLHYAYNSPRLIMALLELGANSTIKDREGNTVLDIASDASYRKPNEYCIKLLREYL